MDAVRERSYPTPYAHSPLLPLLLLSLASRRNAPKTATRHDEEYDYVVVGGGTAGSVVASRLSETPCVTVLLLEAGGEAPLLAQVPALSGFFRGTDLDWKLVTTSQKHTGESLIDKRVPLSSGRVLGGSSALNPSISLRGSREVYDRWARDGAEGWSYDDVRPYFLKLEDNGDPEYLSNGHHRAGGRQSIQRPRYRSGLRSAIFKAARQLGFEVVDPNAVRRSGFYDFQSTLRRGRRCSTAQSYLLPAENRTNLHILTDAVARKVVVEEGVARGVLFEWRGVARRVAVRREVVLSAGAIHSAQLLMLSGIGPKRELEALKIPVVSDVPVGENLADHGAMPLHFLTDGPAPNVLQRMLDPRNLQEYATDGTGILSSVDFTSAVGVVDEGPARFLIRFSEGTSLFPRMHYGLKPEVYARAFGAYENRTIVTCLSQPLYPRSRGKVTLRSADPRDPPLVDPNYLEHQKDAHDIMEG